LPGSTAPEGEDADEVLRLAASLEDASAHPIARVIVDGARRAGLRLTPVTGFATVDGLGVHGAVDGHDVVVGTDGMLLPLASRALLTPRRPRG